MNLKHFIGTTHIRISTYTCVCSTVHLSLRFLEWIITHITHPLFLNPFPKTTVPPFRRLDLLSHRGSQHPGDSLTPTKFLGPSKWVTVSSPGGRTKIAMNLKIFLYASPKNCLHKNNIPRKKSDFLVEKNMCGCKQKESIRQLPLPIQHA